MPASHERLRPLGRDTRWPLPEHDEAIERLDERTRLAAGMIWLRRVESEARAIAGFAQLAEELESIDADPAQVTLARRASDDEVRHAALCRHVASVYLRRPVPELLPPPSDLPAYPGAPPPLLPTLHAVALCCLQETTSSTFIEACLRETTAPLARAALKELLADEIDHARLGWAHLSSPRLSTAAREALGPWLLPLLEANYRFWAPGEAPRTPDDAALLAHGCGTRWLGAEAVRAAIHQLISPGLRLAGFRGSALDAWVEAVPAS